MRPRLLDFLVCPGCRSAFRLEPFAALGSDRAGGGEEVWEGRIVCTGCGRAHPVVEGVPRLLGPALLRPLAVRYPDFFGRHPEFLRDGAPEAADPLAATLESFTRQRLDLRPPGPEVAHQWRAHLARNLGRAASVESLAGRLVLDVGCGFGRHAWVASEAGAEVIGVDLSGGVDVARRNNQGHPRCHVVQANVLERPLRAGAFDVVWSFGVLHHMPDPHAGFAAIVPLARAEGGLVAIWVYGYAGMALSYRLSHMRPLHRVTRGLSDGSRVRASQAVAAVLSAAYWEPLRLLRAAGLGAAAERLPLTSYVDHGWLARVAAVHDRLSTPITHFHDRDELLGWFRGAGLVDVSVEDTDRRGWRAHGLRRDPVALAGTA